MAAGDLTNLNNVKDWIGLKSNGDDALLTRLITASSAFILSWINRALASATYTETRNGTGTKRLTLTNYPVTAVASVSVGGVAVPSYNFVFDQYGIELAGGTFPRGTGNVVVQYTAGYTEMPSDIEQACIELVHLRFQRRLRAADVTSKTQQGEAISFAAPEEMPPSVAGILKQYRGVVIP
jgi:hypothetical protein